MTLVHIAAVGIAAAGLALAAVGPAQAAGYAHWGPHGVVVAHGAPGYAGAGWRGGCCRNGAGVAAGLAVGAAVGVAASRAAIPVAPVYPYAYPYPVRAYAPPPVVYVPGYYAR